MAADSMIYSTGEGQRGKGSPASVMGCATKAEKQCISQLHHLCTRHAAAGMPSAAVKQTEAFDHRPSLKKGLMDAFSTQIRHEQQTVQLEEATT